MKVPMDEKTEKPAERSAFSFRSVSIRVDPCRTGNRRAPQERQRQRPQGHHEAGKGEGPAPGHDRLAADARRACQVQHHAEGERPGDGNDSGGVNGKSKCRSRRLWP